MMDNMLQAPLKGVSMAYVYTVSLLKTNRYSEATAYVEKVRPIFESAITDVPLPLRMAIRTFFTLTSKIEKNSPDDKLYWEYFDMLSYGKF